MLTFVFWFQALQTGTPNEVVSGYLLGQKSPQFSLYGTERTPKGWLGISYEPAEVVSFREGVRRLQVRRRLLYPELAVTTAAGASSGGQIAQPGRVGDTKGDSIWARLKAATNYKLSGASNFAYRSHSISGNQSTFSNDNIGTGETYEQRTNVNLTATLFNYITVETSLLNDPFSAGNRRTVISYQKGSRSILIGNSQPKITENPFVTLNRPLKGIFWEEGIGDFRLKAVRSQVPGAARSVTLQGNNTSGPYYLGFFPIVEGSDRVLVDEKEQRRGADADYVIDYNLGTLLFNNAKPIMETSTIVAIFETKTSRGFQGDIRGYRLDYKASRSVQVGYTLLEQLTGLSSTETGFENKTDNLLGDGTPGPYFLNFAPLREFSETVKVAGVPKLRGQDYQIDYEFGQIRFSDLIPFGAPIKVEYQVRVERAISGDRRVEGFDLSWQPWRGARFRLDTGHSNAGSSGESPGDTATAWVLNWTVPRKKKSIGAQTQLATVEYGSRRIGFNYAGIEGTSLLRNEKGEHWSLNLTPGGILSYSISSENYDRPNGFSSIPGQDLDLINFISRVQTIQLTPRNLPTLNLSRSVQHKSDLADPKQASFRQTTDSLSWSYSPGRNLAVSGTLSSMTNADETHSQSSESKNKSVSVSWTPEGRVQFSCRGNLTTSTISTPQGASETNSKSLYLSLKPLSQTSFTVDYNTQTAAGFGGDSSGTENTRVSTGIQWTPSQSVSVNLSLVKDRQNARFTTNSETDSKTLSVNWDISDSLVVTGMISNQKVVFLDEDGQMTNTFYSIIAGYRPRPGWSASFSFSRNNGTNSISFGGGGSGGDTGTIFHNTQFSLSRALSANQSLEFRFDNQNALGGFLNYDKNTFMLAYTYHLTSQADLTAGLSRIHYTDGGDAASSYKSTTAEGNLSFRF